MPRKFIILLLCESLCFLCVALCTAILILIPDLTGFLHNRDNQLILQPRYFFGDPIFENLSGLFAIMRITVLLENFLPNWNPMLAPFVMRDP